MPVPTQRKPRPRIHREAPPPPESPARSCAESLRDAILAGKLAPGARLLPERALAAELGVNRTTLRAGLRELEAMGLLRARQGSAHVVQDFRASGGPSLLGPLVEVARRERQLLEVARDLLAVRRALAREVVARLVATHPRGLPAASQAQVRAQIEALAARTYDPVESVIEADLAVLRAIVGASGSLVLGLFANAASAAFVGFPELGEAMFRSPRTNAAAWNAALDALSRPLDPSVTDALDELLRARDAETLDRLASSLARDRGARHAARVSSRISARAASFAAPPLRRPNRRPD